MIGKIQDRQGHPNAHPNNQRKLLHKKAGIQAFFIHLGDSHAQMLYYGIKNNLPSDWQILMGVSSGCAAKPNISKPSSTQYCEQSNWFALQTIAKSKPDVVIVAQNLGIRLMP